MFFINKDNIKDFQNRCIVALFLDNHDDVVFEKYVEEFHFKGYLKENENEIRDFYIFDVPDIRKDKRNNLPEDQIVYKYKGAYSKRGFIYKRINNSFIDEYVEFNNNPYDFLSKKFKNKQWESKYGDLIKSDSEILFSNKKDGDKLLVKYKSNPSGISDKKLEQIIVGKKKGPREYDIFMSSLQGKLTFTQPKKMNDPFDCDCDIPMIDVFPSMLRGAMQGTKYSQNASTAIQLNKLQKWWDKLSKEEKERILSYFELKATSNDSSSEEIYEEASQVIRDLYKKFQNKKIPQNKIELILKRYWSMCDRIRNLKDEFRILCLADNARDILMWGYYGNSGEGVCLGHRKADIQKAIDKVEEAVFCIYGAIDYAPQKPEFKPIAGDRLDGIFEYIVKCVFTKYENWEHENEYRYVLLGDDVKKKPVICIQSKLDHRFMGVKYNDVKMYELMDLVNCWPDGNNDVDYLSKHFNSYKLI